MALSLRTNLMAMNASRNLASQYAGLTQSTRRLSSGLRVGTAADDAAGLAIRELMRADIAAFNQGARNVNDAISMIQTTDGALQIIDEKLIRMKELAEQAATGTYDSTQRLMIDSEFQAMASEIERIARATNFNGVKLLCDDPANKLLVATGSRTGIGDGATVEINVSMTKWANANMYSDVNNIIILNKDAITKDTEIWISSHVEIYDVIGSPSPISWDWSAAAGSYIIGNNIGRISVGYDPYSSTWQVTNVENPDPNITVTVAPAPGIGLRFIFTNNTTGIDDLWFTVRDSADCRVSDINQAISFDIEFNREFRRITNGLDDYPNATVWSDNNWNMLNTIYIDLDGDGIADIETLPYVRSNVTDRLRFSLTRDVTDSQQENEYHATEYYTTKIHFGPGNDSAEDYYYIDTLVSRVLSRNFI